MLERNRGHLGVSPDKFTVPPLAESIANGKVSHESVAHSVFLTHISLVIQFNVGLFTDFKGILTSLKSVFPALKFFSI